MIEGIRLGNIMVDCNDDKGLCEFYHKLLGWEKGIMYGCPAIYKEGIVFLFNKEEGYVPPVWPEENSK
ncbi:MAG: VOC family protein, partial [Mobilitalea sp.]